MSFCDCPLNPAIDTIPKVDCEETLGQIVRLAFQRRGTGSVFDASASPTPNPITAIASWTAFASAVDDTKITVTPIFDSHIIPPAEEQLEAGNDNTTPFGEQVSHGAGFIRVTGRYRNFPNAIIQILKKYRCEKNMGIYLINEFGKIWGKELSAGVFTPIPIRNFFTTDAGSEGKNVHDFAPFAYNLREGWRDNIAAATPTDFDATDDVTFLP